MLAFEMTSNRMRDLTKTVLHVPPDSELAGSLGAGAAGHVLGVF